MPSLGRTGSNLPRPGALAGGTWIATGTPLSFITWSLNNQAEFPGIRRGSQTKIVKKVLERTQVFIFEWFASHRCVHRLARHLLPAAHTNSKRGSHGAARSSFPVASSSQRSFHRLPRLAHRGYAV